METICLKPKKRKEIIIYNKITKKEESTDHLTTIG